MLTCNTKNLPKPEQRFYRTLLSRYCDIKIENCSEVTLSTLETRDLDVDATSEFVSLAGVAFNGGELSDHSTSTVQLGGMRDSRRSEFVGQASQMPFEASNLIWNGDFRRFLLNKVFTGEERVLPDGFAATGVNKAPTFTRIGPMASEGHLTAYGCKITTVEADGGLKWKLTVAGDEFQTGIKEHWVTAACWIKNPLYGGPLKGLRFGARLDNGDVLTSETTTVRDQWLRLAFNFRVPIDRKYVELQLTAPGGNGVFYTAEWSATFGFGYPPVLSSHPSNAGALMLLDGIKHSVADKPPATVYHNRGDIVWNSQPGTGQYVGWVCISGSSPGFPAQWKGFGKIE